MYKKILLPVSGKEDGRRTNIAIEHALPLCNGQIVLLHVTEPLPNIVGGEARQELKNEEATKAETLLRPFTDIMEKNNVAYIIRTEEGTPAETIVRIAHEEEVDLIIMVTDGRDGLSDMLLGSITERVLRSTDTALLALR